MPIGISSLFIQLIPIITFIIFLIGIFFLARILLKKTQKFPYILLLLVAAIFFPSISNMISQAFYPYEEFTYALMISLISWLFVWGLLRSEIVSNLDGLAVPQISVMDQPRKEGREATMFCWKCGKALAEHANFCDQCGMPIQQRTQPTVTAQPPHQIPDIDTSQPNDSIPEKPIRSFAGIDTWAWVYATVPLLIQMVLSVLGYGGVGIIAVLIANTIFFFADRRNLELNGIMPASWMWLGIIIVPIYLFVRAHKINQKFGYAVLWCILFFISLSI